MKALAVFLLGLFAVAGIVYFVPSYRNKAIQILSYSECDSPLQYKLGPVDPKFGLSNAEVVSDIQSATDIWSNAWGKQLFSYSPKASLTVSFVFDQRAALNNQINQLQNNLTQKNTTLNQELADYQTQTNAFEQKLAAFNAEVAKYNAQGGAPKDVYDQLLQEQKELNAEGDTLNQRAQQLNLSTNNYNYNVSVLNGDITQFKNELVQKPEEGLYNGANNTITIYFANNKQELLHTLAHEFGHALGMVHVKNKQAIMYAYATNSVQVTPDDMQQLQNVCREESIFVHEFQVFNVWLLTEIQTFRQNFAQ